MSVPLYEVFAIRVGANAQRTARENFLYDACCGDPNAPMPLDYYFWVIRNEQQVIVVDTCFQPATADRRNRQMYRLPEESLRQLDIDPAQVEHLILDRICTGIMPATSGCFPRPPCICRKRNCASAPGRRWPIAR